LGIVKLLRHVVIYNSGRDLADKLNGPVHSFGVMNRSDFNLSNLKHVVLN
jgi:hypothetical protein